MSNNNYSNDQQEGFVLAFDFGGTKMAIATATYSREIIERIEVSTVECGDGETALNRAIQAGAELVQKTKVSFGGMLERIGIASLGVTFTDRVAMAPNISGWENLKIEQKMKEAFPGTPIHIDNDVKAAALAELRRGALKEKRVGLFVNFGTGISAAFTMDNRVLQGHNGAAGEIAYLLRKKDEQQGFKEDVAPFEEFAGGKAIGERSSAYFGTEMTAKDLFVRARKEEPARKFLEEILQEIAFHITNLMISWDPEIVVFGGGLIGASDVILPFIEKYAKQFVPFPPQLAIAHFNRDAGLYGAIELAMEQENRTAN
ncbi:ROK family protein [Peribacillus kribbensis]|uniref:ROK family protein n=1 Tax=Peribacillus kribbensis TaxID=356658 RepID=UPI00040048A8|nr:ROK family protein [Peribacillus kribbensis]